jgi:hypothetical protein
LSIQSRKEERALNAIYIGLARIEKDGMPNSAALRPRDLHYAGYYREIQFGRLAKATGLYGNFGKSPDVEHHAVFPHPLMRTILLKRFGPSVLEDKPGTAINDAPGLYDFWISFFAESPVRD